LVKCNVELNKYFKDEIMKKEVIKDPLGFIEISVNKDKTKFEPKSKIKHLDKSNNKKSFGSACISTSTITVKMLKDTISGFENVGDIVFKDVKKEGLCLIYEYLLRKHNLYWRTIEYNLRKMTAM